MVPYGKGSYHYTFAPRLSFSRESYRKSYRKGLSKSILLENQYE